MLIINNNNDNNNNEHNENDHDDLYYDACFFLSFFHPEELLLKAPVWFHEIINPSMPRASKICRAYTGDQPTQPLVR